MSQGVTNRCHEEEEGAKDKEKENEIEKKNENEIREKKKKLMIRHTT